MKNTRFVLPAAALITGLSLLESTDVAIAQVASSNPPGTTTLTVTPIGVGTCADRTPSSPPATMAITESGEHVRVEVRRYRYYCDLDPRFGATLTDHIIRLRPTEARTTNNCVCLHSSTLQIAPLAPGHYSLELMSAPGGGNPHADVISAVDVRATR